MAVRSRDELIAENEARSQELRMQFSGVQPEPEPATRKDKIIGAGLLILITAVLVLTGAWIDAMIEIGVTLVVFKLLLSLKRWMDKHGPPAVWRNTDDKDLLGHGLFIELIAWPIAALINRRQARRQRQEARPLLH